MSLLGDESQYRITGVVAYSPGSPGWVENARAEFERIARAYASVTSPQMQRDGAGYMVAQCVSLLAELGVFDSTEVRMRTPVIDLLGMLNDLTRGRNHPWAEPSNYGGSSIETTAAKELRIWVLTALVVLEGAGHGTNESCKLIAEALTENGVEGRQSRGRSFPWGTIKRWRSQASEDEQARAAQSANQFWSAVACPHASRIQDCTVAEGSPCIPLRQCAVEFLDQAGLLGLLTDRFRSAGFG